MRALITAFLRAGLSSTPDELLDGFLDAADALRRSAGPSTAYPGDARGRLAALLCAERHVEIATAWKRGYCGECEGRARSFMACGVRMAVPDAAPSRFEVIP